MRLAVAGFVFFVVLAFFLYPSSIEPEAWTPSSKRELPNMPADALNQLSIVPVPFEGPEDVAIDDLGRVYTGLGNGAIVRVMPDGTHEVLAQTGGRPLGLDFDSTGRLIIADAVRGILAMTEEGELTTLVTPDAARFANDVDVGKDDMIFYTTSTEGILLSDYELDIIESRGKGNLYRYDPQLGTVHVLMTDLHFANGVAVSADNSFVAVVETTRYRVKRYHLSGERQGMSDILVDGLPAFPDGISNNGTGSFWIALVAPRDSTIDALAEWPWLRSHIAKLPEALRPSAKRLFQVIKIDETGEIQFVFFDEHAERLTNVSSVEEKNGVIYFASLMDSAFGFVSAPKTAVP